MRVKRTSTLQVGPTLREKNEHKIQPETAREEMRRELVAASRHIQDFGTEGLDDAVEHVARNLADDIDAMVLDYPGRGQYLAPVERRADLSANAPQGSICLTIATGEIFVRTGQQWVLYNGGEQEQNRFLRANESGETGPDSSS